MTHDNLTTFDLGGLRFFTTKVSLCDDDVIELENYFIFVFFV